MAVELSEDERKRRAVARAKRWRAENKGRDRETQRKWRERHPEYASKWRAANKDQINERLRGWRKANKPRCVAYTTDWRKRNPEKARETARRANLKSWYGVTPEWMADTLLAQGGCAICDTRQPEDRGGWNVDHDHATGKTRGVLCGHCNRAIGLLKDSVAVCVSAAQYLANASKEG